MNEYRNCIGIDLGTTNCSMACARQGMIEDVGILQAVSEGLFEKRKTLPSFIYLPPPFQISTMEKWPGFFEGSICGFFAREMSLQQGFRVVQSAKSWVSLSSLNSSRKILPFYPESSVAEKLSPVEAQSRYLNHLRLMGKEIFQDAFVVITIPASFDEYARRLTLESARMAGISDTTLLEEPLSAFYNWLFYQKDKEPSFQSVLVVDVGGGTTDFTLLCYENGWKRQAVGRHLLLGGDNMDLALALLVEKKIARKLSSAQFSQLCALARDYKERFFEQGEEGRAYRILSEGSSLFRDEILVNFIADDVKKAILKGFFPVLDNYEKPSWSFGLVGFGLPFEKDARISVHLGEFLFRHAKNGVDAVLFHGGSLKPEILRRRLLQTICNLTGKMPVELLNPDSSLGVSHGACVYALARNGYGSLIQSGLPYNLFVKVEAKKGEKRFYCIGFLGQKEGEVQSCPDSFQLKGNQRVCFPFYRSDSVTPLKIGEVLESDQDLIALAPLYANLCSKDNFFPARISVEVKPTGDLSLLLRNHRDAAEKFELDFDKGKMTKNLMVFKTPEKEGQWIEFYFGRDAPSRHKEVRFLLKKIEETSGLKRKDWQDEFCRYLAGLLISRHRSRSASVCHEQVWLNATGFFLRPGFGHSLDAELISKIDYVNFVRFPKEVQNRIEYWIFLRRISGGLPADFQNTLFESYFPYLTGAPVLVKLPGGSPSLQEIREMRKCFCCFEHLGKENKKTLFEHMYSLFLKNKLVRDDWWVFSRLLSRSPWYGSFTDVLPSDSGDEFLKTIQGMPECSQIRNLLFSLFSRPGDRLVQFDPELCKKLQTKYGYFENQEITSELEYSFGESLPLGLKLIEI